MLESHYLYLGLMVFSVAFPLAWSFDRRISFYRSWQALALSVLVMGLIFIPWDIWFSMQKFWWFNHRYTLDIDLLGLPLEEYLFFIAIPYACVFIHQALKYLVKKDILGSLARALFLQAGLILLVLSILFRERTYTVICFSLTGMALILAWYFNPKWKGRFLLTYLVSLLPFLLINGALTGAFTQDAVVNYDGAENLGLRIFTIPIEDGVYNLLMLLVVIWFYEYRTQGKERSANIV